MKKAFLSLVVSIAFTTPTWSQARTSAVFFELLGNGGYASLDYDMRFSKSNSGLGGRIGVGLVSIPSSAWFGDYIPTFPIAVNYLTGQGSHHLEASAGITFANENFNLKGGQRIASTCFVPGLGYRYQPTGKGFSFRVFASPFIGKQTQFWGGLSIGARF